MKKKIVLSILLLLNRKNLLPEINQVNDDNKILLLSKENRSDYNEINDDQKDNEAFLDALSKEFTPEELLQLKETSLQEQLNKISKNKDSEVLKSILLMKYARYALLDIKYNVHPVDLMQKNDLDQLQMQNFREHTSSVRAIKKMKSIVKPSIKKIKNIINEIVDKNTPKKKDSIKDPVLKKEFENEKDKLDNLLGLFNNLEKINHIVEKNWFDLFAMKDIGLELVEKDVIDSIPLIAKNQQQKDLLQLVDVSKIIKSNVFQELSVPAVSSLDYNAFFDTLEKVYQMAEEIVLYQDFIKKQQISGKLFLKFLAGLAQEQGREREHLSQLSLDSELAQKVQSLKSAGLHARDLEKSLQLWLKRHKKATQEQINKQADFGTISFHDISKNYDEDQDANIKFDYFLDVISLYLHESGDSIIASKAFNNFKSGSDKNTIIAKLKNKPSDNLTIDTIINFIDKALYNAQFITVSKNDIVVNNKYLNAMKSHIMQWEDIKNKFVEINNKKGFGSYIKLLQAGIATVQDKYLLQSVFNTQISSMILSENIRDFAAKFIKKELPEEGKIIINPEVSKIRLTDVEILPRKFIQFNTKNSSLEAKEDITGVNGTPGAGKSLIAKNFIINVNLARVFGKIPSAKMEISPELDLKKLAIVLIRNQGEIPGELSNHQTNALVFQRLMEYLERRNYYSIVFGDEILSGTNPTSAERMINKNQAIKQLISSGKLSLWTIEHNEETRNRITTRDLCLNFDLKNIKSGKFINEETYKKEYLFESENQELFNAFLDKKFFGPKNPDQSNMQVYFEIDKRNETLKKITKEEYDKINKRNPQNTTSYTYTPLLNNLQNNNDRSGNVTYDKSTEKLIFNQPTILFTSNNKKYIAVLNIKPIYKDNEIIYEIPNTLKFHEDTSLIKENSSLVIIDKYEGQSYEDMPAYLLLSKDGNLQDVANEKIEEQHARSIFRYLEKSREDSEALAAKIEYDDE
jgi:hypothetical protein